MKKMMIVGMMVGLLVSGCVTVFPKVPSLQDQEEKNCTYYLYHKHYERRQT